MLTVKIRLGADAITVSGALTFEQLRTLLQQFFDLSTVGVQQRIDAVTERLEKADDKLKASVSANTPPSS